MTVNENSKPLLTVKGLKQYFKVSNNYTVHAVENVSFQIYPGETYGLVGFRKINDRKKYHKTL